MTMLYNFYLIVMMAVSSLGILHMIYTEDCSYIMFPIAFLVGGIFKFFKDNDDEYLTRNPSEQRKDVFNSIWESYYDDTNIPYTYTEKKHHGTSKTYTTVETQSAYAPKKAKSIYSEIASKCEPKLKVKVID